MGLSGARSSKRPHSGQPAPNMASFPQSHPSRGTRARQLLYLLEGLTNDQGPDPFGSPQTSSPGPVSALWCHCACGEPLATSGAARAFGYFAHFINRCVLMPTTWKLLSGNRGGSMLWGVFWLDCGDRRNSDLGREGRQAAGWPNLGLLGASDDLWSL